MMRTLLEKAIRDPGSTTTGSHSIGIIFLLYADVFVEFSALAIA
jgi:hypothetical protein